MSRNWVAAWGEDGHFEVTNIYSGEKFIIDINKQRCSCNFWGLVGIPCKHAVATIQLKKLKVMDYVDNYYSRDTYDVCYGHKVVSINGMDMWPTIELDKI